LLLVEGGGEVEWRVVLERGGRRVFAARVLDYRGVRRVLARLRSQLEGVEGARAALEELELELVDRVGDRDVFEGDGKLAVWEGEVVEHAKPAMFYVEVPSGAWLGELTYAPLRFYKRREGKLVPVGGGGYRVAPILVLSRERDGGVVEVEPVLLEGSLLELDGVKVAFSFNEALDRPHPTLLTRSVLNRYRLGERRSIAEVYPKVLEGVKRFVNFDWDPRLYHVAACFVVATYYALVFTAFPQLVIVGSRASGKTRAGLTLTLASHRGFVVTNPSEASLYRLAEGIGATMYVDDEVGPGEKMIHVSYKRGVSVVRVEKGRDGRFRIYLYETYCPVILGLKDLPREDPLSRAIVIQMEKMKDPNPDKRDPTPADFASLREELYLAELCEWPRVRDTYRELAKRAEELGLEGRDFEVWGPILAIAKLVGEGVFKQVREFALENIEEKREELYVREREVLAGLERLLLYRLEDLARGELEGWWKSGGEQPPSEPELLAKAYTELEKGVLFSAKSLLRAMREVLAREEGEDNYEKPYTRSQFERSWNEQSLGRFLASRLGRTAPMEKKSSRVFRRLTLSSFMKAAERYSYPVDARLLHVWEFGRVRKPPNSQLSHTWGEVRGPKAGGGVSESHECVDSLSQNGSLGVSVGKGYGRGVPEGGVDRNYSQRELAERILEFVGKEGRPYLELLKFVVRDLKLLNPDSLLRSLFERGVLVKVPREDSSLWVVSGGKG
jgi:hypothetical protein